MTPEDLAVLLTEAAESLAPISGKPSHNNLVRLQKSLTPILLQTGYDKAYEKHSL